MPSRRYLVLATVLVLLNAGLWLAPGALALQQVIVANLFGRNMVRSDIVMKSGKEWRLDRGIVVSNSAGVLTLSEWDGKIQPIAVTSSTKVSGVGNPVGINGVKPGWRVLVTWPAPNGPADAVLIERRGRPSGT